MKKPNDEKAKQAETRQSWVTPDKFEMDCGDPDRETGIPRFPEVQKMLDGLKAKKANSAKD
jgi:hypothetical protein